MALTSRFMSLLPRILSAVACSTLRDHYMVCYCRASCQVRAQSEEHPSLRGQASKLDIAISTDAAGDEVAIRSALERYEDIDMNFAGSREAKLLKVRSPLHPNIFSVTLYLAHCLLPACLGEARHAYGLVLLLLPHCCRLA